MPGFDRTGPEGKGSQTGRKLGKCNPNNKNADQLSETEIPGRGLGKRTGRGPGRGFRTGKGRGMGRANS